MSKRDALFVQKNAAAKLKALTVFTGRETSSMLEEVCERYAESNGLKLGQLVRALPSRPLRKQQSA